MRRGWSREGIVDRGAVEGREEEDEDAFLSRWSEWRLEKGRSHWRISRSEEPENRRTDVDGG